MQKKWIAAAALALLALGAQAAAPTATLNRNWVEYTGAGPIGNNNINNNHNAYWMFESAGTWMGQAVNSWFVFWDPQASRTLDGSISFDQNIAFVLDDKAELIASSSFGKPGVGYDYANKLVGLEAGDKSTTSWAGNVLSVHWNASNPGDHIRVMTVVPEPSGYALAAAGLLIMLYLGRGRRAS